jgi:hypothetical protein
MSSEIVQPWMGELDAGPIFMCSENFVSRDADLHREREVVNGGPPHISAAQRDLTVVSICDTPTSPIRIPIV